MADEKLDYSDPSLLLSEVNKAIATVMVGGQSSRNRATRTFSAIPMQHFLKGDKHELAR